MTARTTLVLGGARSGKSTLAMKMAEDSGFEPVLIATAQSRDPEMDARIAAHRAARAGRWTVIEEPLALAATLRRQPGGRRIIVVDCLTLWLAQIMEAGLDVDRAARELTDTLSDSAIPAVLVSNEVGLGIVPASPLGREFRDAQGRLNQKMAAICDQVIFVAAGLPLVMKPPGAFLALPGLS